MSAPAPRPPELPELPATFRPTRSRVVLLAVGAAMFVVITAIALILEQLSPGERTSFVFVALLFFGVLALLSRPRIVADESGVTVVNITRTRRLAWAEILRVNLRAGDPWVFLDLSATAPACPPSASSPESPRSTPSVTPVHSAHSPNSTAAE
ncbi:hypothetical protein QFZ58_006050 [Streptomyces sp. B1I3]|nr:hypothetical protein [Streptomyces sp. B1I3]